MATYQVYVTVDSYLYKVSFEANVHLGWEENLRYKEILQRSNASKYHNITEIDIKDESVNIMFQTTLSRYNTVPLERSDILSKALVNLSNYETIKYTRCYGKGSIVPLVEIPLRIFSQLQLPIKANRVMTTQRLATIYNNNQNWPYGKLDAYLYYNDTCVADITFMQELAK